MIILIISIFFLTIYATLILYYRKAWLSIPNFNASKNVTPTTLISVIIPARNEAKNIKDCLNSIVTQSYPTNLIEILVVDDFSTDDTAAIVLTYASHHVKLISLKDFIKAEDINSYKKRAIEIAIQQATGNLMVCTDADCVAPPNWLQTIDNFYQKTDANFIAMPVVFNTPTNFIEIFQSLDFLTLQGITGASVYKRIHSMCNGANIAYTKKAFNDVEGFKSIDTIASGDDMLLMLKMYKQNLDKIFFLKSKDVVMQTQSMPTISSFLNQRIRWASKADKYDDKRIFAVLLLVYLFNCLLFFLPIASLFAVHYSLLTIWLVVLILKGFVELFFLLPVATFFNQKKLLKWFFIMQPFHIIYVVFVGWLGKFGKYKWKGRSVK